MLVYSYVLSQDNYLEIVVLQLSHQIISSVNEKFYFAEINYIILHWEIIFKNSICHNSQMCSRKQEFCAAENDDEIW